MNPDDLSPAEQEALQRFEDEEAAQRSADADSTYM
jgi:hypothetical protein